MHLSFCLSSASKSVYGTVPGVCRSECTVVAHTWPLCTDLPLVQFVHYSFVYLKQTLFLGGSRSELLHHHAEAPCCSVLQDAQALQAPVPRLKAPPGSLLR